MKRKDVYDAMELEEAKKELTQREQMISPEKKAKRKIPPHVYEIKDGTEVLGYVITTNVDSAISKWFKSQGITARQHGGKRVEALPTADSLASEASHLTPEQTEQLIEALQARLIRKPGK